MNPASSVLITVYGALITIADRLNDKDRQI